MNPCAVQVSEVTYRLLQAAGATQRTTFVATGGVEVKGKVRAHHFHGWAFQVGKM